MLKLLGNIPNEYEENKIIFPFGWEQMIIATEVYQKILGEFSIGSQKRLQDPNDVEFPFDISSINNSWYTFHYIYGKFLDYGYNVNRSIFHYYSLIINKFIIKPLMCIILVAILQYDTKYKIIHISVTEKIRLYLKIHGIEILQLQN